MCRFSDGNKESTTNFVLSSTVLQIDRSLLVPLGIDIRSIIGLNIDFNIDSTLGDEFYSGHCCFEDLDDQKQWCCVHWKQLPELMNS